MAATIIDLSVTADTSALDKAQKGLKDTGEAAKGATINLKAAEDQMKGLAKQINEVTGVLSPLKAGLAALGGALFVDKLVDMFKSAVEGAASLQKMSVQTGIAVEQLSVMKTVAMQSGTSMDTVTGAVIKFEKGLAAAGRETSIQAKAFKELGINTSDTTKTTEEYMTLATEKLAGLQGGWEKNNIVMALFGKSGTEINQFLEDFANKGDTVAKITAEQAKQAEEYEKSMRRLSAMGMQLNQVFGLGLMPVMKGLSDEYVSAITKTGKLDAESKKLLQNEVEEWAWSGAKAIAWLADIARDTVVVFQNVGMEIAKLMIGTAAWANVIGKALTGDFAGAKAQFDLGNEEIDALTKKQEENAKSTTYFIDMVDKAKAKRDATRNDVAPEDTRRKANNIGEEGAKTGKNSAVKEVTAEFIKQEDSLTKLRAEYTKLYGVADQTASQMVENAIALKKYDEVIVNGVVTKKAATAADLEQLRTNARMEDSLKAVVENVKKEVEARKQAVEISSKMQQVNADDISARVMMQYGKTTTDAAIAVGEYRITLAEQELTSLRAADATKAEIDALILKIQLMGAEQNALDQKKKNEDALKGEQRTFSYGWEQAFSKYKDDASNAALSAQTVFATASKGMEDALVNFAQTGKLSFTDLASSIINDIIRMEAKAAMSKMFGDGKGGFSISSILSMFGGGGGSSYDGAAAAANDTAGLDAAWGSVALADGGPAQAGHTYLVGEQGPELMSVGSAGGFVTPNSALGGGNTTSNTSNNFSITVNGANDAQDTANKITQQIKMMQSVADSRINNATRIGGLNNPIAATAF